MTLPSSTASSGLTLQRTLGLGVAMSMVAGSIIGTGVFLKPAAMAQTGGSELWVTLAWVVAALLSFTGALCYAELGALLPEAGGEYVYIRSTYHPAFSFLYAWMRFFIGAPGSIAAYAVGAATFIVPLLSHVFGLKLSIPILGVAFILVFTAINSMVVTVGGWLQTLLTAFKILAILCLAGVLLYFGTARSPERLLADGPGYQGIFGFSAAVLAALWAFDGWNNLSMIGGELKAPQKNVPRALALGMLIVVVLYLLLNAAFFSALGFDEVAASHSTLHPEAESVAANALLAISNGASLPMAILSVVLMVSALGGMNGSILSSARVPYALAKDGLFPKGFARLSKSRIPLLSVWVQGGIASLLALSGTFDQLTDAVVFSAWIFYALSTGAIFSLRKKLKAEGKVAPYRMPFFPVLPLIFLGVTFWLLVNTVMSQPILTLLGLGMLTLGLPVYAFAARLKRQRTESEA